MKRILIQLVLILLVVSGCKKQLDIKPENVFTESMVLGDPGTAEALLADAYFKTYQASVGTSLNGTAYLLGDISTNAVLLSGTISYNTLINGNLLSTDPAVSNIWNSHYSAINEANVIINQLPGQTWTAAIKNNFIAEAKFLRAYNYFMLLRLFGDGALNGQMDKPGVPLRLTNFQGYDPTQNIPRSKNSDVYAQIFKDLQEASAVLTNSETDNLKVRSRVQQATCYALASRVALYMGDNDKTISYSDSVFQITGKYNLLSSPALVFPDNSAISLGTGYPLNNELIFIFPESYNKNTSDYTNLSYYYKSLNWPNPGFIASYATTDVRKNMFVQGAAPNITTTGRVCPVKFSAGSATNFFAAMRDNIVVLRIAEMYLNKAEALVKKSGVTQPAIDLLNAIHQRSGNTAYAIANFPSSDSLLHTVLRERRWEFAYEGMDRYDQVRIATLQNLPPDLGIQNLNPVLSNSQKWVLPIPNNDVVLSQGMITQNPGY
jgi:hypothetical protein